MMLRLRFSSTVSNTSLLHHPKEYENDKANGFAVFDDLAASDQVKEAARLALLQLDLEGMKKYRKFEAFPIFFFGQWMPVGN